MDEQQEEMLLCARYGEVEDMLALIEQGVSVDSVDGSGNTGDDNNIFLCSCTV